MPLLFQLGVHQVDARDGYRAGTALPIRQIDQAEILNEQNFYSRLSRFTTSRYSSVYSNGCPMEISLCRWFILVDAIVAVVAAVDIGVGIGGRQ